jgi:formate dehydrogenase maturation protein FdhE
VDIRNEEAMISEEETSATCPYCSSPISLIIETFSGGQTYVEDCEVCCKPMQITFKVSNAGGSGRVKNLSVRRLDE